MSEGESNVTINSSIFSSIKVDTIDYTTVGDIIFRTSCGEILRLKDDGSILVKGKEIENDKELVDALREFVTSV